MMSFVTRIPSLIAIAITAYGFYYARDNYGQLLRFLRKQDWAKEYLDLGLMRDLEVIILIVFAFLALTLLESVFARIARLFPKLSEH